MNAGFAGFGLDHASQRVAGLAHQTGSIGIRQSATDQACERSGLFLRRFRLALDGLRGFSGTGLLCFRLVNEALLQRIRHRGNFLALAAGKLGTDGLADVLVLCVAKEPAQFFGCAVLERCGIDHRGSRCGCLCGLHQRVCHHGGSDSRRCTRVHRIGSGATERACGTVDTHCL